MSDTKKPRSDAKLKTLPDARQAIIAEMCRDKSLVSVKAELAADGLVTSIGALSEWLSWYSLRQQYLQAESETEELITLLKRERPDIGEEKLFKYGQEMLSILAIKQESAKSWKMIQDVKNKREELSLAKQKFQRETAEMFLKWHSDKAALDVANSGASNAEKIERLGQIMFGEDWK